MKWTTKTEKVRNYQQILSNGTTLKALPQKLELLMEQTKV